MTKKKSLFNKREIIWNIVNALIAGSLVFLGAMTTGQEITWASIGMSIVASLIVVITKFKDYWNKVCKNKKDNTMIFQFLP